MQNLTLNFNYKVGNLLNSLKKQKNMKMFFFILVSSPRWDENIELEYKEFLCEDVNWDFNLTDGNRITDGQPFIN